MRRTGRGEKRIGEPQHVCRQFEAAFMNVDEAEMDQRQQQPARNGAIDAGSFGHFRTVMERCRPKLSITLRPRAKLETKARLSEGIAVCLLAVMQLRLPVGQPEKRQLNVALRLRIARPVCTVRPQARAAASSGEISGSVTTSATCAPEASRSGANGKGSSGRIPSGLAFTAISLPDRC